MLVKPTILYETSPGSFVGLWKMDKPASFETNKRLSYAHGADSGAWSRSKFLRVPFTINRKKTRKDPTVKVRWDGGPEYTAASLNKALGVWATVTDQGMSYIWTKPNPQKPHSDDTKSEKIFAAECRLVEEEFSDDEIVELLTDSYWNKWETEELLRADIARARKRVESRGGGKRKKPDIDPGLGMTARELQKEPDVELEWLLEGFFPEGTSILGGKPKTGKSLMALHLALAVARGKETLGIQCEKGDVLYIILEGGKRQLRRRLKLFLGDGPKVRWPRNIRFHTKFPRFDEGALKYIKRWLDATENPSLIVVDTLASVKPRVGQQTTATDYDSVAPFTRLLEDHPGVGGIIMAHTKKKSEEDPIDELSGTLGTAAAVNTINVIRREGSKTLFYGRGHEMEEFNKVIELQFPHWRILGDEGKVTTADNPRNILDQMQNACKPLSPKQISEFTKLTVEIVQTTLGRMLKDGLVRKVGRGKYVAD